MGIGRRLLAGAGAIGIALATGLATAGTADAAADCGAGQLCVWMSTDPGTSRSVVNPPVRPQCALVGFGAMMPAVRAVNNTATEVVFSEWRAYGGTCSGRTVRLPAGASISTFPFLVQGVAR
jgi:hypothetical protein